MPPPKPGIIALMGSGELTATMVEVHKSLLRRIGDSPRAVFLDTPAGFQLNADQIARKAEEYFRESVGQPLSTASFKSADHADTLEGRRGLAQLVESDFVLVGPGSPTYALRHLKNSPIPGMLLRRISAGACLVAASAAALTVGRLTLPVYEIYKSGEPLHWVEGLDLLGHFGFNLVVVPHWNNAEGGNHDTRRCFMGTERFERLEALIPPPADILGLDEHTALIIDLSAPAAEVRGIGRVVLRRGGREYAFTKGEHISLAWLRGGPESAPALDAAGDPQAVAPQEQARPVDQDVWDRLHALLDAVDRSLARQEAEAATRALLEIERTIWSGRRELQSTEALGAAREILREALVRFGTELASRPASRTECVAELVAALLAWRDRLREERQWAAADAVRECLHKAGVKVEDTPQGTHWQFAGERSAV